MFRLTGDVPGIAPTAPLIIDSVRHSEEDSSDSITDSGAPGPSQSQASGVPLTSGYVPHLMPAQAPGVSQTSAYVTQHIPTQGPGVPPTTSFIPSITTVQGPGIPPTTSHDPTPTVTTMSGPGVPPNANYNPSLRVTNTCGPGIPPIPSPLVTPSQGPSMMAPLPVLGEDDSDVPATRVPPEKLIELHRRRYTYKTKMAPRVGISAS